MEREKLGLNIDNMEGSRGMPDRWQQYNETTVYMGRENISSCSAGAWRCCSKNATPSLRLAQWAKAQPLTWPKAKYYARLINNEGC